MDRKLLCAPNMQMEYSKMMRVNWYLNNKYIFSHKILIYNGETMKRIGHRCYVFFEDLFKDKYDLTKFTYRINAHLNSRNTYIHTDGFQVLVLPVNDDKTNADSLENIQIELLPIVPSVSSTSKQGDCCVM